MCLFLCLLFWPSYLISLSLNYIEKNIGYAYLYLSADNNDDNNNNNNISLPDTVLGVSQILTHSVF